MNPVIGQLKWVAIDVESGVETPGELEVRLEDVEVRPRDVLYKSVLFEERLRTYYDPNLKHRPDIAQIMKEVEELDPEVLNKVVRVMFIKTIKLNEDFSMSYIEGAREEPLGLGMAIDRTNIETSSWNWFMLEGKTKAVNFKRDVLFELEFKPTDNGPELAYMEFLSDVSLGAKPRNAPRDAGPSWLIKVLSGSNIRWPSLVDGRILVTGNLD